MSIARQRLGKHIPEFTLSKIEEYPLLGNGPINTFLTTEDGVFHGVRAEELQEGTVRRIEGAQRITEEYEGVRRSV
jgi:hypothetical protein